MISTASCYASVFLSLPLIILFCFMYNVRTLQHLILYAPDLYILLLYILLISIL